MPSFAHRTSIATPLGILQQARAVAPRYLASRRTCRAPRVPGCLPAPAAMSGSSPPREETVHDAKSNSLHSMAKRIASHFPQVPLISSTELRQLQDMDTRGGPQVVLVDCRTAQETAVSMIPGSLTQEEFETRRREMEGRTVVTYCTVGYRSSGYAAKLRGQGLEARNLEGGIVRWTQKRYPLVARDTEGGEVETKRVHVYAKPWALQPDDYEAVMFAHPFVSWLRRLLPPWLGGKK